MNFKIIWDKEAKEDIKKFERNIAYRIYKKVNNLEENFNSADIKRLQDSELFRLRVGDYRVLLEINKNIIIILKVGHRKNIYKK